MAVLPAEAHSSIKQYKEANIQHTSAYVADLRQITGYYTGWIDDYSGTNVEDYEIIKDDLVIAPMVAHLAKQAAADTIRIKSSLGQDFEILVAKLLSWLNCNGFTRARMSLIKQSIFFGLGVQRKYYEKKYLDGYGWFEVPVKLKEVDRRRMRLERNPENKNDVYWTIWDPTSDTYRIIEDRAIEPNAALGLQDFIWHIYEHEEMNPTYRGLGEVLYQAAYIKRRLIQYYAEICENWNQPWLVGKINAMMSAINGASSMGPGFFDASRILDEFLDILSKMKANKVLVMADDDDIKLHEASNNGANIVQEFLNYLDSKIKIAILASELTTETTNHGTFAQAEVHRGSEAVNVRYERRNLQECLLKDLVFDTLYRNRVQLFNLGWKLPDPDQLKLIIESEIEQEQQQEEEGKDGAGKWPNPYQ